MKTQPLEHASYLFYQYTLSTKGGPVRYLQFGW